MMPTLPCEHEPEAWFDLDTLGRAHPDVVETCETCPRRETCLADAMREETGLSRHSRYGVFGGLTPIERERLERDGVSV